MQREKLQGLTLFNVIIESSRVIVDFPCFALMSPSDTQVERALQFNVCFALFSFDLDFNLFYYSS